VRGGGAVGTSNARVNQLERTSRRGRCLARSRSLAYERAYSIHSQRNVRAKTRPYTDKLLLLLCHTSPHIPSSTITCYLLLPLPPPHNSHSLAHRPARSRFSRISFSLLLDNRFSSDRLELGQIVIHHRAVHLSSTRISRGTLIDCERSERKGPGSTRRIGKKRELIRKINCDSD
jgi:hypothetical protein